MKTFKLFLIFIFFANILLFAQKKTESEYLKIAKENYQNEQYNKAIKNYKSAIAINPNNFQTYFDLGGVYLVKRDLENFSSSLLKSIDINSQNEETYYFIGQGYAIMDEPDEIIEIFKEKKSDKTNWGALCGGISSVYERMGDLDEAIKYLGKGLITTKYAHQIYTQIGKLYSRYKGNYMKAIENFNRALEYDPTYPKAYYELGLIYGYQNKWLKAKGYFEKAIIYDSKYAAAYYNLGVSYGNLGEELLATKNIKKAASLGDKDAQEFLRVNRIK